MLLAIAIPACLDVRDAAAQDATLPPAIQAELIGKILTFDRALPRYGTTITIGVLHQPDNRGSAAALRDLRRAFEATPAPLPRGVELHVMAIALDGALPSDLSSRVDVLFITPMRAIDLRRIANAAAEQGLLTITAHPAYRGEGPAITLAVADDRPQIVLDLGRSRRAGAEFESRLLRLCEVVE